MCVLFDMRIYVNMDGSKRYEDEDGNEVELTGAALDLAEAANAGGEVDVNEALNILKQYE